MNQRIKDIFDQACFETDYDDAQDLQETMDRFAELIVRECIRLCDQVEIVGSYECIDNIKEHFGVGD